LSADIRDLLIDPSALGPSQQADDQAVGFVDLSVCPTDVGIATLPPFPLIGVGDGSHPIAAALDAVIEPPVSLVSLIRRISAAPLAAAVSTQLLRNLEGLPASRALHFESVAYGLLQASSEHIAWLCGRAPAAHSGPPGRLVVERRDSALHITLDRPLARNAIDRALRDQLVDALTLAALDSEISAVKLRASGAVFCIGGDLAEFGTTRDPATAHVIRGRTSPALLLSGLSDILTVHVQGACVGAGLEMAAFARHVTATSDAWFQLPELSMGLLPGAGGSFSVPRRIGRQRSLLMLLSGRRITAATALRWGLIDAIQDHPS
jgi:hypothetical protein